MTGGQFIATKSYGFLVNQHMCENRNLKKGKMMSVQVCREISLQQHMMMSFLLRMEEDKCVTAKTSKQAESPV